MIEEKPRKLSATCTVCFAFTPKWIGYVLFCIFTLPPTFFEKNHRRVKHINKQRKRCHKVKRSSLLENIAFHIRDHELGGPCMCTKNKLEKARAAAKQLHLNATLSC